MYIQNDAVLRSEGRLTCDRVNKSFRPGRWRKQPQWLLFIADNRGCLVLFVSCLSLYRMKTSDGLKSDTEKYNAKAPIRDVPYVRVGDIEQIASGVTVHVCGMMIRVVLRII
jgi:hypothetical protein